ncbi:MAG TPA: hypothetical protein PLW37_15190, partial [bacterium]|nr:hypothetical protein [bacterium]
DGNQTCSSLGKAYVNGLAICTNSCTTLDESGCDKKLPELKVEFKQYTSTSDRMYVEWQSHTGVKCSDAMNSKTCAVAPVGEIFIRGDGSGYADPNYAYFRDFQNITGTFKAKVSSSYDCTVDRVDIYVSGTKVKTVDTNKNCETSSPTFLMPAAGNVWDIDNFRWQ